MVEPVVPVEHFTWDITRVQEITAQAIELGAVSIFSAALTGFVLSKFIKLMSGRG